MNTKEKILNKIASRTRSEKPIGAMPLRFIEIGIVIVCLLLLLASIVLVGLFIFNIFEKNAIEEFLNQNISISGRFLFEYLVLAIMFILVFVYLYRKFDWPLVKEKNLIFGIAVLLSLTLGLGLASGAEHLFFLRRSMSVVKDTYIDHMPLRKTENAKTSAVLQASSTMIGVISKIVESNEEITLTIMTKGAEELYTIKESIITEKLRIGEKVAFHVDQDGTTITKIKVIK